MNCKQIKEILITDYIDNELNGEQLMAIDKHLSACVACRQFKQELLVNTINPFKNAVNIAPPAYIWNNIRTTIAERQSNRSTLPSFFTRLISFPRVSIAAAVMALMIGSLLYFSSPFKHSTNSNGYSTEENYFSYLYEGFENNDLASSTAEDEDYVSWNLS
jgi:predicted anti-sigma-YlaC factor YlaD